VLGDWLARLANRFRRRKPPIEDLGARLLQQRDELREQLGSQFVLAVACAVGRWAFEYLGLLLALQAIGARVEPTLVLLAFTTAELLGLLPFTPGGLGFVEAGLTGTLALAGISASDAVLATLLFRLVSFWLPLPIGVVALVLFRRRHPKVADGARRDRRPDAGPADATRHTQDRGD
jgi:hypothetical protein